MKKLLILFALACCVLSGCGEKQITEQPQEEKEQPQQIEGTEEQQEDTLNEELLDNISVDFDFQHIVDGKRKIVVGIKNNSDATFTGDLFVSTESSGFDTIYAENIKPYGETFAIVFLNADSEEQLNYSWSECNFEIVETPKEEFSQELTNELKVFAEETWGGAWCAEAKTSWYDSYEDIKVYKQGEQIYATFITTETDENTLNTMCNGLLQYDGQWIDYAQAINKNDNSKIYSKTNPCNRTAWE